MAGAINSVARDRESMTENDTNERGVADSGTEGPRRSAEVTLTCTHEHVGPPAGRVRVPLAACGAGWSRNRNTTQNCPRGICSSAHGCVAH